MNKAGQFFDKKFWAPVLTLVSGTGIAQLITLTAIPVLTRLYSPLEFGQLATYLAIVLSISVMINGGYEWPIMLPEKDKDAHQLLILSLLIALGGSFLLFIFAIITGEMATTLFAWEELGNWYFLIPLSIFLEGIIQALTMMVNRIRKYRIISLSKMARTSARVGVALSMGYSGGGVEGLILALLAGEIACSIFLFIPYISWLNKQKFPKVPLAFKTDLKNYQDFPRYGILSNWLNTTSKQLPYLLFPALYPLNNTGSVANGFFHKADQLLSVPVGLIGNSVGSVFYEQGSKAKQEGEQELGKFTLQTTRRLIILGLPVLIIILFTGPWLFEKVLGNPWREAGVYAQYLSPYVYLLLIATPLSFIVDIERKLKPFLWFTLLVFTIKLITLWLGSISLAPSSLVKLFSLVSCLLLLVQISLYLIWGHALSYFKAQALK